MSTKAKNKPAPTRASVDTEKGKIDLAELKRLASENTNWEESEGETYGGGLNIVKIDQGATAGPFLLVKILKHQMLGKNTGKTKKKPVDVYIAADANGREARMPVAASFRKAAEEGSLAVGDAFLIRRGTNYESKEWGTKNCAAYEVKILKRA